MENFKRIINFILLFIMALVFFGLFYFSKSDENSITNFDKIEGKISLVKISQIDGARSKLDVLFINILNVQKDFIYLKKNQNYGDFLNSLKKGDFVKLHYKEDFGKNRFEIIQLEKDNYSL